MLEVAEARRLVLLHAGRLPTDHVDLTAALGLVLAEDVASDVDAPPYDKALVDGYALRTADVPNGVAALLVVEEIAAGNVPARGLSPGEAARIMTGAQLPLGADAVVMVERTRMLDELRVQIHDAVQPEQNVLRMGREMRRSEVILHSGTTLRPQELGLLATVGKPVAPVFRQPRVAVLSTGDEVVEPKLRPGPAQIRNSNAYLLQGQVLRARGVPHYLGIARDQPGQLRPLIDQGLRFDVLLITGGVSAGKRDFVPEVLRELGVDAVFHKVKMKPGKPLFFGKRGATLVFGLPGNPVSALVGFELFVRPALRKMLGHAEVGPVMRTARLAMEHHASGDRTTYHPGRLMATDEGWSVSPVPWFGSADLRAISQANAFIVFEAGDAHHVPGDVVSVLDPE